MMKKLLAFLILCSLILPSLCGGEITVTSQIDNTTPATGEEISYQLDVVVSGDSIDSNARLELPSGNDFVISEDPVDQRYFSTVFNGRKTYRQMLVFRISFTRAGKITVPPAKIFAGSREFTGNPVQVNVSAAAATMDGTLEFAAERNYYVGENLPVNFTIKAPGSLTGRSKAVWHNIRNLAIPLAPVQYGRLAPNRRSFAGYAELQLISPGELSPELVVPIRYRTIRNGIKTEHVRLKANRSIKIVPLPPPPPGVIDTKLIGNWQLNASLSKNPCPVGETTKLLIQLRMAGQGSVPGRITPPVLKIPGCRVYPGEVRHNNSDAVLISYDLLPLAPGKHVTTLTLAIFDPVQGKYQLRQIPFFLLATGTERLLTANDEGETQTPVPVPAPAAARSEPAKPDISAIPDHPVALPLWLNVRPALVVTALFTVLLTAVTIAARWFCKMMRLRTAPRLRQLREFNRGLAGGIQFEQLAARYGLSAIAESLKLPAGATAEDIAEAVEDDDLKHFFRELSAAGFRPDLPPPALPPPLHKKMRNFIKHLMLWSLIFSALTSTATEPSGSSNSAKLFYQMAAAEERTGDLAAARALLLRSSLLAPRNPEIAAALNEIEKKLQLPQKNQNLSPAGTLIKWRDQLRPDSYLLIAAIAAALLAIALLFFRQMNIYCRIALPTLALLSIFIALSALFTQSAGPYSSRRLILRGNPPEIRAVPLASAQPQIRLLPGSEVELVEQKGNWLHILSDSGYGWIETDNAIQVFPYGIW